MDQLDSLRFDMWVNGERDVCAFDIQAPDGAPGLAHVWFVLERHELQDIVSGQRNTAVDGHHKLEVWGDDWMFYDFSLPSGAAGTLQVPFRRVTMPRLFIKALLRGAKRTWAAMRANAPEDSWRQPRLEYVIPLEHRQRVCRLYGQGKGSVTWFFAGQQTTAMLGHVRAVGGETLDRGLATLEAIARNCTKGFHETATVRLFASDPTGFDWCVYSPSGRPVTHGGLINHGHRNGGHDWSVHT